MSRAVSQFSAVLQRIVQIVTCSGPVATQTSTSLAGRLQILLNEQAGSLLRNSAAEDELSKCWSLYSSKKQSVDADPERCSLLLALATASDKLESPIELRLKFWLEACSLLSAGQHRVQHLAATLKLVRCFTAQKVNNCAKIPLRCHKQFNTAGSSIAEVYCRYFVYCCAGKY